MLKRTCPNNHVYDASIYGDSCPLCPSGAATVPVQPGNPTVAMPQDPMQGSAGAHTRIASPQALGAAGIQPQQMGGGMQQPVYGSAPQQPVAGGWAGGAMPNPTGETRVSPQARQAMAQQGGAAQRQMAAGSKTVIRRNPAVAGGAKTSAGRKLVGFLVTYNRDPMGKSFNIYEGRNFVGRDASCDICVPDDNQMSGRHMSILYRSVDNKFKFRDEQSSNGTFVNKELLDDGTLENYDIIRVGSTLFIFVAIPQIG